MIERSSHQESSGSGLEQETDECDGIPLETSQDAALENSAKPYVLLLDLDETIIRSSRQKPTISDYAEAKLVSYMDNGEECQSWVILRPHVNELLSAVSQKYKIYIYTASTLAYAEACIKILETAGAISGIYSRTECKKTGDNSFEKDIFSFGYDESKLVFVDDWKGQTAHAPKNSINIKFFNGRRSDIELIKLTEFLLEVSEESDVRNAVEKYDKFRSKGFSSRLEEREFKPLRGQVLAAWASYNDIYNLWEKFSSRVERSRLI